MFSFSTATMPTGCCRTHSPAGVAQPIALVKQQGNPA
ncbi:hypothetical protein X755_10720 [Mesorhizobium sp. LNJC405B00]|nr:hypothetical protein X755_10720 [Mesorhizobium sp. LNJC405B00]